MTVRELTQKLIEQTGAKRETTCDVIIAGDGEKQVHKVATCFKATVEVIREAHARGVDLLICHEPVFYGEESRENADPIAQKKWELLDQTGITVFRYHDHAHEMHPDYIHEGFIRSVGLDVDASQTYPRVQLGICKYALRQPIPLQELIANIKNNLNVPCVRVAGAQNMTVKSVFLGLGGTMWTRQFSLLHQQDADVFITGEIGEVLGGEYIRDSVALGEDKAVIILGHYGSEYAGMRYLAEDITARYVPAEYIDCGECFAAY